MDRIAVSGTADMGSIPVGTTKAQHSIGHPINAALFVDVIKTVSKY